MRTVWTIVLAVLLLGGGMGFVAVRLYWASGPLEEARDVIVPRGGLTVVASALSSSGVIEHRLTFRLAALATSAGGAMHTAELHFPARASLAAVLDVLRHGRPVQHLVTIPEGLEAAQIARVLARQAPLLDGDLYVAEEGTVLPETYAFEQGTRFATLAARGRRAMERELASAWRGRATGLPLKSPSEALILASIVEHEAKLPVERPMIARVFLNRLAAGMRLQADPTAAYGAGGGMGLSGRKLDRDDLERDDPYNTYVVKGLPAGPICSPGLESVTAVLHPASGNALYFVADGTGGHVFSESLGQHVANVARYRRQEANPSSGRRF